VSDLSTAGDLSGRTAVIAGAASDIGAAIATRLAAAGANLILGDVDTERMRPTVERLGGTGAGVLALPTDVTLRAEVESLVQRAVGAFGSIDVMVNVAGVIHDSLVVETREADLDRVLAVNLKGTYFGCQAAAAAMTERGAGSIVNMASLAAFSPMPKLSCYGISKAGVVALTKVLAQEVGPLGVRVNAIAPGFVEGGMTTRRARRPDGSIDAELLEAERARARRRSPLRSTGLPEDIAEVTHFLASDASRYLTGQVLHPNGGSYMP
jgi:3-oxoacyl-[acyl-carrier protein] reductase